GLSMLRDHTPFNLTCTCDGEVFHTRVNMVMGANTSVYAYGVRMARNASVHDGLLDLFMLEAADSPFPVQVAAAICNRLGPRVGARTIRGRKIHIECDPPVAVQIDGDPAGQTPLDIECIPAALKIVV